MSVVAVSNHRPMFRHDTCSPHSHSSSTTRQVARHAAVLQQPGGQEAGPSPRAVGIVQRCPPAQPGLSWRRRRRRRPRQLRAWRRDGRTSELRRCRHPALLLAAAALVSAPTGSSQAQGKCHSLEFQKLALARNGGLPMRLFGWADCCDSNVIWVGMSTTRGAATTRLFAILLHTNSVTFDVFN